MKQEYNTEELLAQIAALNNLFDEVRLIDPQTASVLDPDTLQPVGQADNLPILGEDGRALRYLDGEEDFVLYQAITLPFWERVIDNRDTIQVPKHLKS